MQQRELTPEAAMESRRLMWVWSDMKRRCTKPNHPAYANYGGRGITVCESWMLSLQAFLSDMGPRPSRKHSLDRSDNDKGYSKDNCRWVTRKEQNLNKREYKNTKTGLRNIFFERHIVKGHLYERWRVRVRRDNTVVSHKRFHNLEDAIAHRDKLEQEYANG